VKQEERKIMVKMLKPTPMDEQIKLDKHKYIMSRTDTQGNIEFGNDYFFEISGYTANELMGRSHNIIRHPDMPKVIFKLMWDRLKQGKNIFAVVKNMAKDGRYYWVTTKFEIKKNPIDNSVVGYMAYRQAATPATVDTMKELYEELLQIEKAGGIEASEKYLIGYLDSKRMTYDEFIDDVIGNKGAFKLFFATMAKLFGGK
jgi:PAS domain S-box-containing protein